MSGRPMAAPSAELDIREKGREKDGQPQILDKRLFMQLHVFSECMDPQPVIEVLKSSQLESVVYLDFNNPTGIGILFMSEDPDSFVTQVREVLNQDAFQILAYHPEMMMVGRTYSVGHEPDLEDWLLKKPRRSCFSDSMNWAIWYPLHRKSEFALLPRQEQGKILMEHGSIGRAYGEAGFATDIRLACHGLDQSDNEFVIGVIGENLYPLSRLIQEMRGTQQTGKYMHSMGPFFVGKKVWNS